MKEAKGHPIVGSVVISIILTIGIIMGVGYGLSNNSNSQDGVHIVNPSYEIIAEESGDVVSSIIWKLPESVRDHFVARLYSDAGMQLTIDVESMEYTEEIMATAYYYPVLITRIDEQEPYALAEVHFRHIDNGDVVYHVTASLLNGYETPTTLSDVQLVWEIEESTDLERWQQEGSNELYYILYGEVFNNVASTWMNMNVADSFDLELDTHISYVVPLPKAAMFTDRLRFGMVDVFSSLENNVIVEHFDLSPDASLEVSLDSRKWSAQLPLHSMAGVPMVTEHWGVLSSKRLVQFISIDERGEDSNIVAQDIRIADLDRFRKMRHDGMYYEVPTSYTPYEPRAFWRVPAEHIGQRFIRSIREQENARQAIQSSYLETIAIVSVNHNLKQQTTGGYWITEPQSNWLYNDYGIEAGFYDTRFSTDAAMFLLDMYTYYRNDATETSAIQITELDQLFDAVTDYANFLVWFADQYSFITENGGLLVQDYFHPTVAHEPTHVSLNHLATEMNFLLQYFQALNLIDDAVSSQYLNTAKKIRQAIHDTDMQWVKENHDLWYAYLPDGTYGLEDYPRLTRNDLRISVGLIDQVLQEDDEIFRKLIFYKEKYLQENGIPLW